MKKEMDLIFAHASRDFHLSNPYLNLKCGNASVRKKERGTTFGNGVLNFSAFKDDIVVVDTLFFFNEIIVVTILGSIVGRIMISSRRELDSRNKYPLKQSEADSDEGTNRNQNLRSEIWENGCPHGSE